MLGFIVLSGLIAAPFAPLLHSIFKMRLGWVIAFLPGMIFAYLAAQLPAISAGQVISSQWEWVPSLGLTLSFRLDGLSLLFALLISGIGALVAIYGGSYLKGHQDLGRFFLYLLLFMAAMLGVVLSDNLLALFVFWELTSISSYLLIGFNHDQAESRAGALKALLITGSGGLVMMAGFILLGQMTGTFNISNLPTNLAESPLYVPMVIMILIGAFTKSAQWPFHIWLPDAMQAPTPVSAYLHSATMVKAGVYLLARLSPVLEDSSIWFYGVSTIGLVTMVAGGVLALKQTDLKAILAYTTIGWLGTLVMLLGWGHDYAVEAAMVGILAHALYKGALFMLAGGIDHETGTRDIRRLSGLRRVMPITMGLMFAAAFSMAGLPLLFGFISKELLLEAVLHVDYGTPMNWVAIGAVILASLLNVAIGLRLTLGLFLGPLRYPEQETTKIHDPYPGMLLGPGVLAGLTVLLGVWPGAANGFMAQASSQVYGELLTVKLALWHGLTTALWLSLTAIGLGVVVYGVYAAAAAVVSRFLYPVFNTGYEFLLAGLLRGSERITGVLQNGKLRYYLATIFVAAALLVGLALFIYQDTLFAAGLPQLPFPGLYEFLLGLIIVVTAIRITRSTGRIEAIAGLGVIGALISLLFVLYSAPDLALTQLLIETLMVIVFLLVFHFLPQFFEERTLRLSQIRDIVISLFVGLTATSLVLLAVGTDLPVTQQSLASYFTENSYELAHGRNIVNVILVDFRGTDTLGEIAVLAIAAIGILALLRGRR